jgi:alcohol dehydrogenase class IV
MKLIGNWNYPTAYRFGAGRARSLPARVAELGTSQPFIVTDPGLAALDFIQNILNDFAAVNIKATLFSDIKANPTGENITAGAAHYNQGNHDCLIAIGGGSALDAGKAIALLAGQNRPLWDFVDEGDNWQRVDESVIPRIIAVPTTAGTGSEVGRASVITDEEAKAKRIVFHPKMMPDLVVADPKLTVGLPPTLTAATGMDALSHCLEAYCAPGYHPMAVGIAVEGMRLIKNWLPIAVQDGNNLEARSHMLVASSMGATAFQRGLGAMHALAHPLGALYDVHHGTLNAVLMPYVLTANRQAIEGNIETLATSLGFKDASFTAFLDWVLALRSELGMPHTLAEMGIDATKADLVGEMASFDPTAGTNPIPFTAKEYSQIFERAVAGNL